MAKTLLQKLNGLQLSIEEVQRNNPGWNEKQCLDYIGRSEDISLLARELGSLVNVPQFGQQVDFEQALNRVLFSAPFTIESEAPILMQVPSMEVRVYTGQTTITNGETLSIPIGGSVGQNAVLTLNVSEGYVFEDFADSAAAINLSVGGNIESNRQNIELRTETIAFPSPGTVTVLDSTVDWTVTDYR